MTVYFIGAGPGAPDLITLRGRDLIARCPVCLFAGSLVPEAVIDHAPGTARKINSAHLSLGEIIEEMETADTASFDVARVHSGDPSIYSAIGEQIAALKELGIPYEIVPGVPAFAAAAASLGRELTLPGIAQTVILTRTSKRSSAMPDRENLATLASAGATLVIHLSAKVVDQISQELSPFYGADCPAVVVAKASWPDEQIIEGTLGDIAEKTSAAGIERTALILVGPVLSGEMQGTSALYDATHARYLKPGS